MRKLFITLTILLGLSLAPLSFAAPAFDSAVDGGVSVNATSLTWNHTISSTSTNPIAYAGCIGSTASDDVTDANYANVVMTLLAKHKTNADRWTYFWQLTNPATGTNSFVVHRSPSGFIECGSIDYIGARETSEPDASSTATNTGTSPLAGTLTTVTDNSWAVLFGYNANNSMTTAGASTTQRIKSSDSAWQIGDSNLGIHPAGSFTLNLNFTSLGTDGEMASFAPFTAAPAKRRKATIINLSQIPETTQHTG